MIEVDSLRKRFGALVAVDGISFQARPGEVLGFLGPNGAGKTTTMRVIAGFLIPDEGRVRVCGHDVVEQPRAAKAALGYLPEGAPAYGDMEVGDFLGFIADARCLSGAKRRERLAEVLARLELGRQLRQPIETLSKGFKRRVGLAAAILHDPPALVLDEPTDGLDPNQKHEVRGLIRELARDRTLVISTHILEEVEAVCSRAVIIADGRIVADAAPAELLARSRYQGAASFGSADSVAARAALEGMPEVAAVEQGADGRIYVFPRGQRRIEELVAARLRQKDLAFSALQTERGRLDDVFRALTQARAATPADAKAGAA
jgi:ABC-2 type transport system ATP-binding protein